MSAAIKDLAEKVRGGAAEHLPELLGRLAAWADMTEEMGWGRFGEARGRLAGWLIGRRDR